MKHFTFPQYDFSDPETESLYAVLRAARTDLTAKQQDLAFAVKMAKRSPAKWNPTIADRQALVTTYEAVVASATAACDANHDARRAARDEILFAARDEILSYFGPITAASNGVSLVRINIAGDDAQQIVIVDRGSSDSVSFEVSLVEKATDRKVFGFDANVYGPRLGFRDETVTPAYPSWGSYSGMTTVALAEQMLSVLRLATHVAQVTNEVFGL